MKTGRFENLTQYYPLVCYLTSIKVQATCALLFFWIRPSVIYHKILLKACFLEFQNCRQQAGFIFFPFFDAGLGTFLLNIFGGLLGI